MISLGPFMLTWHGLLTALGLVVSVYAARHYARRFGFDPEIIWALAPYLVVAALVGGRLAYVGAHLAEFRTAPLEVLRLDRGGLGSFGALIAALAALYLFSRTRRLPLWHLADALAVAIPINYLAMRIGNAMLIRRARSLPFEGFLFWWTLFYTSAIRFAMDLFRSEWRAVGVLTLGQIGALGLAGLALGVLFLQRRRNVVLAEAKGRM